MNRSSILLTSFLGVLLLIFAGCQTPGSSGPTSDQIVAATDLSRDTALARSENTRGADLLAQKQFPEAEAAFKKAIAADSFFGPAHNNLGKACFAQDRLYEAVREFQFAADLMPERPEPYYNMGLVFEKVGKQEKAFETYAKAVELGPDNAVYIGNLARMHVRRGDRDEATRDLLQQLVLKDKRPDWRDWAQKTLALMEQSDDQLTSGWAKAPIAIYEDSFPFRGIAMNAKTSFKLSDRPDPENPGASARLGAAFAWGTSDLGSDPTNGRGTQGLAVLPSSRYPPVWASGSD